MNLNKLILTENECYKVGTPIVPAGIIVHSTGANNPNLKRYLPNDGKIGVNKYGNHWNQFHPDGRQICCHAFIGKLADGTLATYQTLPWTIQGWHSGSGSLIESRRFGYATNNANRLGFIGFEICEDDTNDPEYARACFDEAVDLCVYLCKEYDLDPEKDILSHKEGHRVGIASNHGDPNHWWDKHGLTMDAFRAKVKEGLTPEAQQPKKYYRVQLGAFSSKSNAEAFLKEVKKTYPNAFLKFS